SPRAVVSVVTLLGGIETRLQSVSIQSEEQIEISLSSIESMFGSDSLSFTADLHEYLTKMNPTSILKNSTPSSSTPFDQMYMFLCEEDLFTVTQKAMNLRPTVQLAPLVRWFIIGRAFCPNRLRAPLESIKRHFAPPTGDFDVLKCEDTVADDLIDRLLPPSEVKPVLALGTKTAEFVINPCSGVRSIEVLGFMPLGSLSTSNLSQFSYEEDYIFEIGQDPDFDEAQPTKKGYDIDGDYFGTFSEPEQQLLPLLLNGMMKESVAAFCQVCLKEDSEYLAIKRAFATLEGSDGMDEDEGEIVEEKMEDPTPTPDVPVYAVLFATTKKGNSYEETGDENPEVDSDGPSDDEDIDDVIEEEQGKTVRLTLSFLSPSMTRPGWPDMEQWDSEVKLVDPADKPPKFWETAKYETKSNRWLDDAVFGREVTTSLIKHAQRKNYKQLKMEIDALEDELRVRAMDLLSIDDILDTVVDAIEDEETIDHIHAMKRGAK
ncbi:hypothetical protein PENTCL1PPCAC_19871, partial [Pristionchus entomophagus]